MEVNTPDFWIAHMAALECSKALASNGISLRVTVDAAEVATSVASIGKDYLTPWLDPSLNDFTEGNFFWLIAEKKEVPVIVGGGRLDRYGNDGAGTIRRLFERSHGPESIAYVSDAVSVGLRGTVCYLGDLHSKAGVGLSRANRRFYLGVAHYIASVHFRADATYSFMRTSDVMRGSADINGFDQRISEPYGWVEPPSKRSNDEVLVYRRAENNAMYFNALRRELAAYEEGSVVDPAQSGLRAQA